MTSWIRQHANCERHCCVRSLASAPEQSCFTFTVARSSRSSRGCLKSTRIQLPSPGETRDNRSQSESNTAGHDTPTVRLKPGILARRVHRHSQLVGNLILQRDCTFIYPASRVCSQSQAAHPSVAPTPTAAGAQVSDCLGPAYGMPGCLCMANPVHWRRRHLAARLAHPAVKANMGTDGQLTRHSLHWQDCLAILAR